MYLSKKLSRSEYICAKGPFWIPFMDSVHTYLKRGAAAEKMEEPKDGRRLERIRVF